MSRRLARALAFAATAVCLTAAIARAIEGTWVPIAPTGPVPPPRMGHNLVLDPPRRRLLAYGGYDYGQARHDIWAMPLAQPGAWAPLYVPGTLPGPRLQASLVYEPPRDRFVLFGGKSLSRYYEDVWAFTSLGNFGEWTRLAVAEGPGPRETVAAYDSARGRIVYAGGYGGTYLSDLWALQTAGTTGEWTVLAPGPPQPTGRYGSSLVLDTSRRRLLLFGGVAGTSYVADIFALDLTSTPHQWTPLFPAAGTGPIPRYGHVAAYDPDRDAMIVVGGWAPNVGLLDDAWLLRLSGTVRWEAVTVAGPRPAPRDFSAAVWDPVERRLLMHGGNSTEAAFSDTWALVLSSEAVAAPPLEPRLALLGAWPNPTSRTPTLEFSLPAAGRARVELFDIAGRRVVRWERAVAAGTHRATLAADAPLAPGLYLAALTFAGERRTARIVVAH